MKPNYSNAADGREPLMLNLMILLKPYIILSLASILSISAIVELPIRSSPIKNENLAQHYRNSRQMIDRLNFEVNFDARNLNSYGLSKARELSRGHSVNWNTASTSMSGSLLSIAMQGRLEISKLPDCDINLKLNFIAEPSDSRRYPIYFNYRKPNVDVYNCGVTSLFVSPEKKSQKNS